MYSNQMTGPRLSVRGPQRSGMGPADHTEFLGPQIYTLTTARATRGPVFARGQKVKIEITVPYNIRQKPHKLDT